MSSEAGLGPAEQSPEFKKAVEDVKKLKQKPSDNERLELYGLYKTGIRSPHISEVKAPGMLSGLEARYKYNAHKKYENLSAAEAQKKYVELVESLKQQYGFDG